MTASRVAVTTEHAVSGPPQSVPLAPDIKRTSLVRRVVLPIETKAVPRQAFEGDVCAFRLSDDGGPIILEDATGRVLTIVPRDVFLSCPGHRESLRWVIGGVPEGGLVPGEHYWTLAECGVVGAFTGQSLSAKSYLGKVTYLGAVQHDSGRNLNMTDFAVNMGWQRTPDRGVPVFLVVGTSSEIGKTTAAIAVMRTLLRNGGSVLVLKATGTSAVSELHTYQDHGAKPCLDIVDFGLPTTHPYVRDDIAPIYEGVLDYCLAQPATAMLIECGGDMMGATVPVFLACLRKRRADMKVILVAPDSLAALGGKIVLERMGYPVTVITGPCTDTASIQKRTVELCGVPAINMSSGSGSPVAV